MNKKTLFSIAVFCVSISFGAQAGEDFTDQSNWDIGHLGVSQDQKVDSDDPCTVGYCMYGELVGSGGGSECSSPIKHFFSIAKFGRHGFDAGKTLSKRRDFLGGCPSLPGNNKADILSKYGRKLGL